MPKGRFAKRNTATVNRRPQAPAHDAHVTAWIWSEQRAHACGYIAAIDGQAVRKGGAQ